MKEQNMTFGQFIRKKRLDSPNDLTLREVSEKLGISLTMYSDIEKDRRTPSDNFDYEALADELGLDAAEKALMYDLAARRKRTVPSDIEDIMMYSESGNLARMALRMTNEGTANEDDWKTFIRELERKRGKGSD
ncbi:helix-turn-helix domain-containing protein [Eubacterium sp. AB3007]|uniref:helix-turn-helix domain-containing protein n=1 Tax=Eubacterium sp. AB3007 TaxID=1392487 RepID=UPI00047F5A1E|nr:helix-turn-helix transcriptional regulator [Eubacterium sp. AB3007]